MKKSIQNQGKTEFTFAMKDISSSKIAGLIIIKKVNWKTKQGEFDYCISSEYENKGWMSKAIALTSKYVFDVFDVFDFQKF